MSSGDSNSDRDRHRSGNIVELLEQHRNSLRNDSLPERAIDRAASLLATVGSVYLHLFVFGVGILLASGVVRLPGVKLNLDILALIAGVEAIFVTTFVLIAQRRMQELGDMRANLTLHISLLEERETTRLIHLVTRIAEKHGIKVEDDEELAELMKEVKPEDVLDEIDAGVKSRDDSHGSS